MISKVSIQNFKSHKNTILNLKNLTVLCGNNGVGKSSAIQLFLLLREAYVKDKSFDILDLKSNPVKVGTPNDAIYQFSQNDSFQIDLITTDEELSFLYEAKSADDKVKTFISLNKEKSKTSNTVLSESLFNTNFQYIGASRFGPQEKYEKDDKIVGVHKQISVLEGKAEYFVHYLDKYKDEEVIKEICKLDQTTKYTDLAAQVIAWEKSISTGVNIVIEDIGKLGFLLKYNFETEASPNKRTNNFEATNVGFGLSYVMPILVAILSAKKGALIIIENPEAHLHPNGIANLTELICLAAQAGIQIILETHSDHIINGILVQSKKFEEGEKGIDRNNVSIYHFDRDENEHCTRSTKVEIEEDGLIRYPPKGFFDQFSIDRRFLMGF
jgi:predicted ATPase